jgi:hypothetical protein
MVTSTFKSLGIATVDDGEVIPVANTPLRPPPLPEPPPPSISDNIINNGYEYSVTSTDGEKLLFRSMYRVQVPNDKAMNILHDESMKEYNDAIAITQVLLVVLYQVKYKTIRPFHLSTTAPATAPDTDTTGNDLEDNGYEYSVTSINGELILLFRLVYRVDRKYRMVDTILSSTGLLLQSGSEHNDGDDLISITTTVRRPLSSTTVKMDIGHPVSKGKFRTLVKVNLGRHTSR